MKTQTKQLLYGLTHFDCARDIRTSTWENDNPNKAEKYNEMGIMFCNKDDNTDLSIIYFEEAVDYGNINAMINGFGVLWNAGFYLYSYSWLKRMNVRPIKNIKCLWNQAMLLYYGSDIEHNPVKQNKKEATVILEYIVGHYYDFLENKSREIVQKAYIFLLKHNLHKIGDASLSAYELWKDMTIERRKNYAAIGYNMFVALSEYHDFPYDLGHFIGDEFMNSKVFHCLDELYVMDDWNLGFVIGDMRGIFLFKESASKAKSLDKYLRGTCTRRAAWQAYLLNSWYKCLPLEDHDNYDACRPIFKADDLSLWRFSTFMPDRDYDTVTEDMKTIFTDEMLMPTVECIGTSKNQFCITCVWWNDWRGLFKEKAIVEFDKNNRPTMKVLSSETLYKYWCPVEI